MDSRVHSFNTFQLLRKTLAVDRSKYQDYYRPLSLFRLGQMFVPNLSRPIFIIGAPRSGTTFLGSCLAVLPELSYHFEPIATKAAARLVYDRHWNFTQARLFYRWVYSLLMCQHCDADLRFAEKTPRNCFLVNFLSHAFPDAQFIHIIRDGRDVALSLSKRPWFQAKQARSNKREPGGYLVGPYARFWVEPERVAEFESTSDIHRCIWSWCRHTDTALRSAKYLPKEQYFEIRYESLVTNPILNAVQLLDFLNIESLKSRNLFHAAVEKAKSDSVGQWRQLSDKKLLDIMKEAETLLKHLDYI